MCACTILLLVAIFQFTVVQDVAESHKSVVLIQNRIHIANFYEKSSIIKFAADHWAGVYKCADISHTLLPIYIIDFTGVVYYFPVKIFTVADTQTCFIECHVKIYVTYYVNECIFNTT